MGDRRRASGHGFRDRPRRFVRRWDEVLVRLDVELTDHFTKIHWPSPLQSGLAGAKALLASTVHLDLVAQVHVHAILSPQRFHQGRLG